MNKRDVIKYCLTLPNTFEDYPFQDDTVSVVMKHTNNKKWHKSTFDTRCMRIFIQTKTRIQHTTSIFYVPKPDTRFIT